MREITFIENRDFRCSFFDLGQGSLRAITREWSPNHTAIVELRVTIASRIDMPFVQHEHLEIPDNDGIVQMTLEYATGFVNVSVFTKNITLILNCRYNEVVWLLRVVMCKRL